MTAPCKDCTSHRPGCHGGCSRYAEYKAALERMNKNRNNDRDLKAAFIASTQRMQKRNPIKMDECNRRRTK